MSPSTAILGYVASMCVNPDKGRPLTFENYEYLTQPLQDLAPRIVVQKAAQVGATVLAILRALWFVDVQRAHTMYLFPTHRSATRFSRGRFSVLLEQSPYLRGLFREVRNAEHMRTGVANFYCHGARSRTELMSTPVQYLTLDERDELYLGSLPGRQPWSAVELARQRLSGQRECWELNLSTPTIPGHGIAAEFARSDQHYYHPRCPHCNRYVRLIWPDAVQWAAGSRQWAANSGPWTAGSGQWTETRGGAPTHYPLGIALCSLPPAYFCCPRCRKPWNDDDRRQAIRDGCWAALFPSRPLRGYHLSQLLSPAATAPRLVAQWLACQENPAAKQVFYNSVLGLPYIAEGARLERRFLEEALARGGYPMAITSQGSVMGVDVGPTWFHIVIAEPMGEWLRLVWVGKAYEWRQLPELIRRYHVQCYVIDAMPETHQARELLRAFPQGFMCYYRGPGTLAVDPALRIVRTPRTESLDAMYLRWRLGKVVAPQDLPTEFIEQLMAPVRVVRVQRDGQAYAEYLDSGQPDHYAHAMNYCELALLLRGQPLRFEVVPPDREGRFRW